MRTDALSIFNAPIGSIGRTLLNLWALLSAFAVIASLLMPRGALAQEAAGPAIALELNGAQASEKGCRFTFVVTNGLKAELERAAYEIALFDAGGVVDRLAVLDFKDLPAGKTKVTRFDLTGVDCAAVSRILVNGSTACVGAGVEPTACMRQLDPRSKTAIQFGI